ncbi:MAG: tetratricopeptide repeat protein, partial [Bacteroidetes bacterium]
EPSTPAGEETKAEEPEEETPPTPPSDETPTVQAPDEPADAGTAQEDEGEEEIELIQLEWEEEAEEPAMPFGEPSQEELERLFEIEEEDAEEGAGEEVAAGGQAASPAAPVTDLESLDEHAASRAEEEAARPSPEEEEHTPPPAVPESLDEDDELARKIADEGLELVRKGKVREALRRFEEAIADHPQNVVLRYEYAFFLAKYAHDVAAATRTLEEVRAMDPEFADAWFLLGELAETHGDYHLARNYYEKVLELDPDYPGLHYHLGVLLFNHFLPDEAELAARHLKKSLKQYKKNADAHYRLAILYDEYLDRPEKAVKHYKKTLKYEPGHPLAAYDLAVHYHRREAWELARHYYLLACELNPEVQTPENDQAFGLTTDEEGFPVADQVHVHDFGRPPASS